MDMIYVCWYRSWYCVAERSYCQVFIAKLLFIPFSVLYILERNLSYTQSIWRKKITSLREEHLHRLSEVLSLRKFVFPLSFIYLIIHLVNYNSLRINSLFPLQSWECRLLFSQLPLSRMGMKLELVEISQNSVLTENWKCRCDQTGTKKASDGSMKSVSLLYLETCIVLWKDIKKVSWLDNIFLHN